MAAPDLGRYRAVVAIGACLRPTLASVRICRRCRSLNLILGFGMISSEEEDMLWKRLRLLSLLLGAGGVLGRRSQHTQSSLVLGGLVVQLGGMRRYCGGSRRIYRRRSAR